ncbi:MAG TPA: response regulator [Verrucomicrobiae bacterium]|nr:response regulator [Verrucomicrobiae bacterium]
MKKVLIIEDDQIVAHIYRNKFIIEGFQVEVAYTGEAGLELINSYRPDAVLLDLVLPKISGVELMNAVRAESQFKTLPLIVFSNTYLTNLVQDAWKAGATKCLSKASCTPKQVIDAVRSTLSLKDEPPKRPANNQPLQPTASVSQPAPAAVDPEVKFQTELHSAFVITLPTVLAALRASVKSLAKADAEFTRIAHVEEMYKRVHALTANANLAGLAVISQLSEAFEALLKELQEKPKLINSSTMRTVATAVDFLGVLFDQAVAPGHQAPATARILVVDDEAISRRAVTSALERAKLKSTPVEDPNVAFKLLTEGHYDLIFLDVDMPQMNGFELCTKLRALPKYKSTPVVFVTSLNDFESRTSSMMSGGNDFIAKPFHFLELAVKALVYVLRGKYPVGKRN